MALQRSDIKKSKIYPVLVLESVVSEQMMDRLIRISEAFFFAFAIITMAGALIISRMGIPNAAAVAHAVSLKLLGLLALDMAFLTIVVMFRAYLRSSYYFENVVQNHYRGKDLYTFTVGRILYRTSGDCWLEGLLRSEVGQLIMARCGVSSEQVEGFLKNHQDVPTSVILSPDTVLKLRDYVSILYDENKDFSQLLYTVGIGKTDLLNVVDWIVKGIEAGEMAARWWRRENLDRLGSLGRGWAYGITPILDMYGDDLLDRPEALFSPYEVSFRNKEVRQIEDVLSRSSEANVLLVGESEPVRMDVLWTFVREIERGYILPNLEHKRVILFNSSLFLSSFKERAEFEQETVKVFEEVRRAGDVVLVFSDFAAFLKGAESLHSQIFSVLDQYFASSQLQIVAMSDTDKFHQSIETRSEVMSRFEKVLISDLSSDEVVMTLLENVDLLERMNNVRFSYQSLKEVVKSAETYFSEGALTEKSKDLISELVPWFLHFGRSIVVAEDVRKYISEKVNVPVGEITEDERKVLTNLEIALHGRVIGQDQAVMAIASAMKRARAGIQNPKRPLGSFLFLGPTGVGKTETAKALAFSYFGSEDKMMRLDMTEYQDDDALEKLIGSFKQDKPGVLSNMIRQNVFGVLLLDEFEKTHKDVLNLFLQILDEGFFSDMNGKRVNARNIIFIATSNAGANTIWNMVKAGKDPAAERDTIVNEIVNAGVYKPELLNRFDDVIVFHPLTADNLRQIASLMLNKLAKRLETKGLKLVVNDYLIQKVCQEGANEVFGARPMNRYIQDTVEQTIADKIITGEVHAGVSVEFREPAAGDTAPFALTIS